MRTIYKYPLEVLSPPGVRTISLPGGERANVRAVGVDALGISAVWIECDTAHDESDKRFYVTWTGHPCPDDSMWGYCGTVVVAGLVLRVYELVQL